jgi:hypothetical protein
MTLFIAIWGAALGTLTFFWNLWKWRLENPCIVVTVEAVESFWTENTFGGIRMTLRNRGGKITTVERIYLYRRQDWFEYGFVGILLRFQREVPWQQDVGVSNSKTAKIPVVLDVNELWEGFIPLEANEPDNEEELRQISINRAIPEILRSGKLRYSILCSHTNRRIRGLVQNETIWTRE